MKLISEKATEQHTGRLRFEKEYEAGPITYRNHLSITEDILFAEGKLSEPSLFLKSATGLSCTQAEMKELLPYLQCFAETGKLFPEPRAQPYAIVINGQKKEIAEDEMSYARIVSMVFTFRPGDRFTVIYRHGPEGNPAGSLLEGQAVEITDGMVFSVAMTTNA